MLPLGAVPAVEHVITECLAAGASEVLVVTRPDDDIIPAYVRGLHERGLPVNHVPEDLYHGYGNATPLLSVRDHLAGCGSFMVAFGDDVLLGESRPGANLAAMRGRLHDDPGAAAVIAAQRIDPTQIRSFGAVDTVPGDPTRVVGIQQRPDPTTVREPLALVSRLVLRPLILDRLTPTDLARGEVDLGVAVGQLAATAHVAVHRIAGDWVTVGDPRRYFNALRTYWRHHPDPDPNPTGT